MTFVRAEFLKLFKLGIIVIKLLVGIEINFLEIFREIFRGKFVAKIS